MFGTLPFVSLALVTCVLTAPISDEHFEAKCHTAALSLYSCSHPASPVSVVPEAFITSSSSNPTATDVTPWNPSSSGHGTGSSRTTSMNWADILGLSNSSIIDPSETTSGYDGNTTTASTFQSFTTRSRCPSKRNTHSTDLFTTRISTTSCIPTLITIALTSTSRLSSLDASYTTITFCLPSIRHTLYTHTMMLTPASMIDTSSMASSSGSPNPISVCSSSATLANNSGSMIEPTGFSSITIPMMNKTASAVPTVTATNTINDTKTQPDLPSTPHTIRRAFTDVRTFTVTKTQTGTRPTTSTKSRISSQQIYSTLTPLPTTITVSPLPSTPGSNTKPTDECSGVCPVTLSSTLQKTSKPLTKSLITVTQYVTGRLTVCVLPGGSQTLNCKTATSIPTISGVQPVPATLSTSYGYKRDKSSLQTPKSDTRDNAFIDVEPDTVADAADLVHEAKDGLRWVKL